MADKRINRNITKRTNIKNNKSYQDRTPQSGRRKKRNRILRRILPPYFAFLCILLILCCLAARPQSISTDFLSHAPSSSPILPEDVPDELEELLSLNEETHLFVTEYENRAFYLNQEVDLSEDSSVQTALAAEEPPLLLQWDLRWGYAPYGDSILGLAGCGPACLSMAYIGLTKDTSMHPAVMAEFADRHGYHTASGTDWALWTDGAALLGLKGETLALDEYAMKNALDNGSFIVCSMRPGDFTTTGHFILLRGYDENGFLVNDPNRKSNSDKQWSYDELSRQIKNLWELSI